MNLDMHVDDSEVTLNVNIFDGFRGAGLTFCGMFGTAAHRKEGMKYTHQVRVRAKALRARPCDHAPAARARGHACGAPQARRGLAGRWRATQPDHVVQVR